MCSQVFNCQYLSIDSGNGLVPNRWWAILLWIIYRQVPWCHMVSSSNNELNKSLCICIPWYETSPQTQLSLIMLSINMSRLAINSSLPSAEYVHWWTGSTLVPIMTCRLVGAKPLSKPMLEYAFENVICEMAAILSRGRWGNLLLTHFNQTALKLQMAV